MRLQKGNLDEQSRSQFREFTKWLLQFGNATITCMERSDNNDEVGDQIEIPQNLLIKYFDDLINLIIEPVYPQFQLNYVELEYLRQQAIIIDYSEAILL